MYIKSNRTLGSFKRSKLKHDLYYYVVPLTIQPSLNYKYATLPLVNYLGDYSTINFKKRVVHAKKTKKKEKRDLYNKHKCAAI